MAEIYTDRKALTLAQVLCANSKASVLLFCAHVLVTHMLLNTSSGWSLGTYVLVAPGTSGSTLTISIHCHDNMTRAMLVKSLHYRRFVCPRRDTGTMVGENRSISTL